MKPSTRYVVVSGGVAVIAYGHGWLYALTKGDVQVFAQAVAIICASCSVLLLVVAGASAIGGGE